MLLRRHLLLGGLAAACGASHAAFREPLAFAAPAVRNPERRPLLGVAVAGKRLVAVGMRGLIVVSDDSGATWRQVPLALSVDLVSVMFANSRRGWACGHNGVVLTTGDGGLSWAVQLKGMDFANVLIRHYEQAVAAGHKGASERLESVKLSFASGPEQPVLGLWFDSEQTGWAVSTFGMILGTTDGGKSWTPWMDEVDNPDLLHLYSISGLGPHVLITSERGRLFKLDRDRKRFVALNTGYQGGLFGMAGTADAWTTYGLQGTALRSRDSGVSWQRLDTGVRVGLNGGVALPDGRLMLVTQDGRLLSSADPSGAFQAKRMQRPGLLAGLALATPQQLVVVGFSGVQLVPS